MILVIDNYDSFTYNLVQYLGQMGEKPVVYRNDKIGTRDIKRIAPSSILISPGPGTPSDAGVSKEVIAEFAGKIPILGVCLGHQAIAEVFGAKVVRGSRIMHGKVSPVYHKAEGIFKGVPSPFEATRYHSLVVKPDTLTPVLKLTAWTMDEEIMGICHRKYPVWGVQFHPESILTVQGMKILKNFVDMAKKGR
ncbi:MAG: aminodeoxychorismate/anthranilate synthase component II [Candidatus Omnitrophica bacterium]|nr:aminodeoxychorismate/anthranilate synthase component II [Candidatus Omnitrophota bacterium]MDD4013395.1 aminodeoxychorismate/anthranilate synthase component II [Candidatus Omnitrophota bacterium]